MRGALVFILLLIGAACVPTPVDPPGRDSGLKIVRDGGVRDVGGITEPDAGGEDGGLPHDSGTVHDAGVRPDAMPQPDRDSDGIPDDEDPMPDSPNTLLFADTFEQTGGWLFSSVSMRIDPPNSQLIVSRLEPFEREGWIGPEPGWGDYLIRTLVRVGSVGNSSDAQSGHAGLIARVSQVTPSRYVTCGIDLKRNLLVFAEHEGTARRTLASAPATLQPGDWIRVNLQTFGMNYTCTVDGVELTAMSGTFFAGSVGFRTYDATFAADWIEVYEIF